MRPLIPKQISQLLDQYARSLELYASQWVNNPEDCVQDAFIELAGQSHSPDSVVAWLYRVVRNKAFNASRSQSRRTKHERLAATLAAALEGNKSESASDRFADQEELRLALESLAREDRELIVLRIWSGLSWAEIAELTETSSSSAHRRYVSALTRMKEILEPSCPTNLKSHLN